VLHLSNGSTINDKLTAEEGRVARLLAGDPKTDELLTRAWMLCLSREPTPEERAAFNAMLAEAEPSGKRQAVEDVFWALLTSREFLFQH
jgi:hypothetical protein